MTSLQIGDKAYYLIQKDPDRKIAVEIISVNLNLELDEFYTVRVTGHRTHPYKRGERFTTGHNWLRPRGIKRSK